MRSAKAEICGRRPRPSRTTLFEKHAEDINLSTLKRVAKAFGKRLEVTIAQL
jgi:hypothetical protein